MARGRPKPGGEITLFPFLSILACVIGTLTLIISALVLGQVGAGTGPDPDTNLSVNEIQSMIQESARKLDVITALTARLEQYKSKAANLGLTGSPQDLTEALPLLAKIAELEQELAWLRDQLETLRKKVAQKRELIKKSQMTVVRWISPDGSHPGSAQGMDATYIECRVDRLIVHPERSEISVNEVGSGKFKERLDRIKRRSDRRSLVFLIRPEGVETFRNAQRVVDNANIKYGYVPLVYDGEIKFAQDTFPQ